MAEQLSGQNRISADHRTLPGKILVAVDGSEESLAAAQYAIDLAKRIEAELSVLHVILLPEYVSQDVSDRLSKDLSAKGEAAVNKVRQDAARKGIAHRERLLTTTKSVVTTICEFARDDDAGLIVMGASGAGGVAKVMLGTVAVGVARESRCPVLLVR